MKKKGDTVIKSRNGSLKREDSKERGIFPVKRSREVIEKAGISYFYVSLYCHFLP